MPVVRLEKNHIVPAIAGFGQEHVSVHHAVRLAKHHIVIVITQMEHVVKQNAVRELLKNMMIFTLAVLLKMEHHIVLAITRMEHVRQPLVVREL